MKHNRYYVYEEQGIFVITEELRSKSVPTRLPWDLFQDHRQIAVGYIRWSDEKQNTGHSYSIQEQAIILKAKRLGFEGVVIFIEAARSAYHYSVQKREKMNALKQFILLNTNADTVIFYDESRVTRAITDFYTEMIIPIREKKPQLKLYSTQHEGEWNENDPLVQMKFAIDHEESALKARRVRDSQMNFISKEKRPPSSAPYGYSPIEKGSGELIQNDDADIVVFIFYLYSYGCSNKKIAELLEVAKIPSPSGYGHWSDSSINYILTNIWYIGSLSWERRMSFSNSQKKLLDEVTVLKNHHPALIDAGLSETTQYFRSLKVKKNRMDSPFILKGLITCKDCDLELETKNQTSTKSVSDSSFYYCPLCKGRAKKTAINELVLQDFAQRWGREMKHYQKQLQAEMKSWQKVCKTKAEALTNEIELIRFNMSKLKRTDEQYELLIDIAQQQLTVAEQEKLRYLHTDEQIKQMMDEAITVELLGRFKEDLHVYSNAEKRAILLLAIQSMIYDFKRGDIEIEYRLTPYVELEDTMKSIAQTKKVTV